MSTIRNLILEAVMNESMSEAGAARQANKIYAAYKADQISRSDAVKALEKLETWMSSAQLMKFKDWLDLKTPNNFKG